MIIAVEFSWNFAWFIIKNDIISEFNLDININLEHTVKLSRLTGRRAGVHWTSTRVLVLITWLSATALVTSELNSINRCPLHQDASCIINFKDSCGVCLIPTDLWSLFTRMRVKWETVSDAFRSESVYELCTHHSNHMYRDWHLWRQTDRAMMMMMMMEQVKTFYN